MHTANDVSVNKSFSLLERLISLTVQIKYHVLTQLIASDVDRHIFGMCLSMPNFPSLILTPANLRLLGQSLFFLQCTLKENNSLANLQHAHVFRQSCPCSAGRRARGRRFWRGNITTVQQFGFQTFPSARIGTYARDPSGARRWCERGQVLLFF